MKKNIKQYNLGRGVLATAVLAAIWSLPTQAFEINTGNPDLVVRFDNTVRLNYVQRVEEANSKVANAWNNNDGDNNFSSGSPVSQRIDVLTEFDVVYQGNKGFRVSTSSWYDHAYDNVGSNNNNAPNQIKDGRQTSQGMSNYAERYYNGISGEFLDAFVFAGTELDNGMMLDGKIGQTTNYWGETLFNTAHGNSFGQGAVNISKGLAVPGSEAKELFIPRKQIYGSWLLNEEVSLAAQYFFGWDNSRLPESGTYLGYNDPTQSGSDLSVIVANNPFAAIPGANSKLWLANGHVYKPQKSGDYGLKASWSPEWLDGTLSAFYRETSDVLPYVGLKTNTALLANANNRISGNVGTYNQYYADDIKIYGLSLAKSVGSVTVGWDLNYRKNMPLRSLTASIVPDGTPLAIGQAYAPGSTGEIPGSRGDTIHSVLNGVAAFGNTPMWDSSSLALELAYDHVVSVDNKNSQLYKGSSWYQGQDKVTPNFWSIQGSFTPTWFQVFPSVDLSMPMTYSTGLSGVSAVNAGGSRNAGSYSVGIAADVLNKYRFDLKYIDYFGPFDTCDTGSDGPNANGTSACTPGQITSFVDSNPVLKDRGMIAATFKTSF